MDSCPTLPYPYTLHGLMSHTSLSPYFVWIHCPTMSYPHTYHWHSICTTSHQSHTNRVGSVRALPHPVITKHAVYFTRVFIKFVLYTTYRQNTYFLAFTDYHNGKEICVKWDAFHLKSKTHINGPQCLVDMFMTLKGISKVRPDQ